MSRKLKGQVTAITGAGSGIGRATALLFASEGAKVAVGDIRMAEAEKTVAEIRQMSGEAVAVSVDVSNVASVKAMVGSVHTQLGPANVLFNNAAIIMPKFIEEIDEDDWQRVVGVNLSGVFYCTKYFLPDLKLTQGCIVNMGSMNGLGGQQKNPAYSATKGAVIAMTRSLAVDLAPLGVRVNAICPAGVMTPLLEAWFQQQPDPPAMKKNSDLSHMLGRTADSEEIAKLALFLASDDSSFITGQAIPIEGGATLGYGVGPKAEWKSIMEPEGEP
jgi:NAD(P)-dependent dehydrogenase (short-subunit alcohol dehydrogenase family)